MISSYFRYRLALSVFGLFCATAAGANGPPVMTPAQRKAIDGELRKLYFSTRVEQRCNARAMGIVRREHWPMDPDEGAVRAFSEPEEDGARLHAAGAALRMGGRWRRILFDCQTTSDGLGIVAFAYTLGDFVPKSEWREHGLGAP